MDNKWQFWIDRGGTFTDVVARGLDGGFSAFKFLSENPDQYSDAALYAMRLIMAVPDGADFPSDRVSAIKMGTTVATNALLERRGTPTLLLTNSGLEDALLIGQQHRSHLFDLKPTRPAPLFECVASIPARLDADGEVVTPFDAADCHTALQQAYDAGLRAVAIVLMHAHKNPDHELSAADIAKTIGFTQISCSHQASSLGKYISRGDTAVADAYLSPILYHYRDSVKAAVGDTPLYFMQSHGGLTAADHFHGKDAVLSGPAGGIVGAVKTAEKAGLHHIIGFDMGGTSTDVAHYSGEFERTTDSVIAGVRISVPMMDIHTVAAGGGSICSTRDGRLQIGPESAGAHPGPACYGKGGPLTITDCNLLTGKLQPDLFPAVFGPNGDQKLDAEAALDKLEQILTTVNAALPTGTPPMSVDDLAEGFLDIASQHMARAIRKISVERGHDIQSHALVCFGGAGGQHATSVADLLGIDRVLVPPFSGVLSALGMGLAPLADIRRRTLDIPLASNKATIDSGLKDLASEATNHLLAQGLAAETLTLIHRITLKYAGSDSGLLLPLSDRLSDDFASAHQRAFGYHDAEKPLVVESIEVEAFGGSDPSALNGQAVKGDGDCAKRALYKNGAAHNTRFLPKGFIYPGAPITGPVVITEENATTIVDPGWQVTRTADDALLLERITARSSENVDSSKPDPILLEVFNNLFMSVAEEMGGVLASTAHSVNIKERLDFSCAVFSASGELVANAPHMPVHLGSMGASVRAVVDGLAKSGETICAGDSFMLNDPYAGGTHLPDITVVSPVFMAGASKPDFFVASRGHHADIGGMTPGSMPADSRTIEQEGIRFSALKIVSGGKFEEDIIRATLADHENPARKIDQNIADLKAQLAANQRGAAQTLALIDHYGYETVSRYMDFVRDNAQQAVEMAIQSLPNGSTRYELDNGSHIDVTITVNGNRLTVDFTGTSDQVDGNFNAPLAVTKAAVLYVMRALVDHDIPLNEGCMKPVDLIVPPRSILNPAYPAAVVAGNVEVSQAVTNALFIAAGRMAASQGTMNNLTFGDDRHQYYETIAGGTGAGLGLDGIGFDGSDAIHSHMTNSRLTDPEVLEQRYPVRLSQFGVRHGSGGAGQFHGGAGLVRAIEFLSPLSFSILSNHRRLPPPGLNGGAAGKVGVNSLTHRNGNVTILKGCDSGTAQTGDILTIKTPGGGGYKEAK